MAARLGVPVISLDEIWQPGWGPPEVPAFRAELERLHAGDAWISDGNFAQASFDLRLPRADAIVWLEAPRWLATWRVLKRLRLRDLWRSLVFVWRFDRRNRPRIESLRRAHAPETPVFHVGVGKRDDPEILSNLGVAQVNPPSRYSPTE